eukprot:jgi/Tetstr1/431083/TSEL_020799.t1
MDALPFAPRRFTCEPAVELAEKLASIAPGGLSRCLFTTGGSDANEVALKIARAATGRFKTVSFWDAFHGAGFGAASVGGEHTFRSGIAGPLLPGAEHVAPFACFRCPYNHAGPETCGLACARMVDYVLEREGDVAAVIAEPMRAVPYVPPPGFWKAALGGGILPIAAVIANSDLNVAGDYAIGHYTHEKNPVTARAALTTLEIIEDEGLVERSAKLGAHAMTRLHEDLAGNPIVGDIRGRGLMFGVEIVTDRAERTPGNDLAEAIYYRCLDAGLSFKISQGCVLTLSPPLTIARAELDRALDIVRDAIRAVC